MSKEKVLQFPFNNKTRAKAAEQYARQGWHIFPVHSIREGVCTCDRGNECTSAGKHPIISPKAIKEWTVEQAQGWWKKFPYANIGVWLEGSTIGVLDLDKKIEEGIDGEAALGLLCQTKGIAWPATLSCRTGSGGLHLYFSYDKDRPVPNKANALGPGIDCWSGQHYLILPPSDHKSGGCYVWENWGSTPTTFPYELLPEKRGPGRPRGSSAKEPFDPRDKWQCLKMARALELLEPYAADREMWVKVGMILGRAYKWSDDGFTLYDAWSKKTDRDNYDERNTRRNYYEWSKHAPPDYTELITTASLFHWARQHGELQDEPEDERPLEFYENPTHAHEEREQLATVFGHFDKVFRRDSMLIEIVEIGADGSAEDKVWRPAGYPITRQLSVPSALNYIAELTQWYGRVAGKYVKARPSRIIVSDFISTYQDHWNKLKPFRMFAEFPTIREDGSLLSEPGYDAESGLYLINVPKDICIPTKIGVKQIKTAMETLWKPFQHYRFEDELQSKSAFYSAIFTICLRHLFPNVPMFSFTAAKAAAGKTKACQAISRIWFNKNPATLRYTKDEDEMSKVLASCAMAGDRNITFDNVPENMQVRDPVLAGLLTSPEFDFRILGTNERVKMSPVATFFMTGIKLEFSEEIQRRTMQIKIEPHKIPDNAPTPEAYASKNRSTLISAALTVVRGFHLAKRPKAYQDTLASFEEWGFIRDMLAYADETIPDPKTSISEDLIENEEVSAKKEVVKGLFKLGIMAELRTAEYIANELRALNDRKTHDDNVLTARFVALNLGDLLSERAFGELFSSRTIGRLLKRCTGIPIEHEAGKVLILRRIGRGYVVQEHDE